MPLPVLPADPDPARVPDAVALLEAMRRGDMSPEQVVGQHLDRLEAANRNLNAATHVFRDEAMAEARDPRPGPLSGLPVSVKETFGLAGHTVTAGSLRMPAQDAPEDAEAVRRLRAAGAIVVARSNVPEFAMAGETESPRYGLTRNPLDPARTCGGSSGGEAVIVACGGSAAGLGSDILGSIRIPASFCGLVGFKPESAAVSKTGSWPTLTGRFTDSWLCAGPIARSVRDARLLYEVLSGGPVERPGSLAGKRLIEPTGFPLSFRQQAIPAALAGGREGLISAGMRREAAGLGEVGKWYRDMIRFLGWELLPLLQEQLGGPAPDGMSLLSETLRRWRGDPQIYDGLYRLLLVGKLARYRTERGASGYVRRIEAARDRVRGLLGDDGVMLLPTLGTLAPRHGEMNRLSLRPGVNGLFTSLTLCNYLNLPAITVPAWRYRDPGTGMVPGVMLVGPPGGEGLLFEAAECLESIVGISRNGEGRR